MTGDNGIGPKHSDLTVSVILPYYNGSGLVNTSVDSVLAQNYRTFELIIIDDGSDPAEAAYLERFDDPRIIILRQQNAGVSAARNAGIKRASGHWLAFIDQDDSWEPEKLDRQVNYVASHPECKALHTAVRRLTADGTSAVYRKRDLDLEDFLWTSPNPSYLSSTIIKRNSLYQAGLFNQAFRYSQDHECFLRCARLFPFHYLDEVLVTRHEHGGNLSGDKPGCWREAVEIIRLYKNEYEDTASFKKCLYRVHMENGRLAVRQKDLSWFREILAVLKQEEFSRLVYLLKLFSGRQGISAELRERP